jgi:hypothetical protein
VWLREVRVSRLKFSLAIEFALFLVKCRDRIPVNHASHARSRWPNTTVTAATPEREFSSSLLHSSLPSSICFSSSPRDDRVSSSFSNTNQSSSASQFRRSALFPCLKLSVNQPITWHTTIIIQSESSPDDSDSLNTIYSLPPKSCLGSRYYQRALLLSRHGSSAFSSVTLQLHVTKC